MYLGLILYAASRVTGGLSGVAIIVLPFVWAFLWFRVWVALWLATAILPTEGIEHTVLSCVVGFFSSLALMVAIGHSGGWKVWWPLFAGTVLSHVVGATLLRVWNTRSPVPKPTQR